MGIQINGQTDTITSTDGTFTLAGQVGIPSTTELTPTSLETSGVNVTGVVTATTFDGNLTGNVTGNVTGDVTGSFSGSGVNVTGIVTATSYQGDGSALTGIDATSLKDSGGNVKIQAEASGAVVTGVLTASSSIEVGPAFLKSTGVGIGSTTTAGRDAGIGTALGTLIYNSTTSSIESYSGEGGWLTVKNMSQETQYFVFTSPGTANLTSTYNFSPEATVDILHINAGGSGSPGQPGHPGNETGGEGGAGGAGGTLNYKIGQTIGQTGTSFPVTTPAYPSPVMPSPQPGGGPHAGGPGNPGPNAHAGIPGTNASFTLTPFAPYFPAYALSDGNGGAGGPVGNSQFAGDGGSGGGGGLIVAPNGQLPAPIAPTTDNTITGTNGNTAAGTGGRNPGPGGSGGQGYGAGGGGGAGGAENYGSTTGGAAGGAGAPGLMIIKVSGFLQ